MHEQTTPLLWPPLLKRPSAGEICDKLRGPGEVGRGWKWCSGDPSAACAIRTGVLCVAECAGEAICAGGFPELLLNLRCICAQLS